MHMDFHSNVFKVSAEIIHDDFVFDIIRLLILMHQCVGRIYSNVLAVKVEIVFTLLYIV